MKKIKFLLVFLPLLLGVIIYLLYRSKNLFYYNFIHFLNINGYVLFAREVATLYRKLFPTWVIYSLPDGLWLFSTGAVFLIAIKKYLLHFFCFLFISLLLFYYFSKNNLDSSLVYVDDIVVIDDSTIF